MLKQDYITTKELGEKLDECDINSLINYVDEVVKHIEIIGANEDDIIRANKIKCDENTSDHINENEYDIEVTNEKIDMWKFKDSVCFFGFSFPTTFTIQEEKELKAKGIILNFILKILNKKEIADVKQIALKNAIGNKNMNKLESKIEEFAARILIPKSFFSEELGNDIIRIYLDGKDAIIDVETERNLILEKLKSFGVTDEMARLRLKIANFEGKYDDYTDREYLNSFTYYYDEMQKKKEPVKKMKKNEE